jgi:GNAT superfamily N-acetyltransferase
LLPLNLRIRQATLSDAPLLAQYNLQLALETEDLRLDPATVNQGVRAVLQDPAKGIYYVVEAEGAVVGQLMITYEWSDWRNGQIWWIQSVYVLPDFRGRGVFTALFRHIESLARSQKEVCSLRLYMHADNAAARRAYERLGMKATAYQVFELELPSRISQYQP